MPRRLPPLMPRLFRFRRVHGDIDVRVAISERLADFVSDGIDIAIRCGGGQYTGLSAELLMKEDHFPVCSPQLLKGRYPLRTPADLARHTLLHDVFTVDWAYGCAAPGSIMSIRIAVRRFCRPITRSRLQYGARASCSAVAL